MSEPDTSGDKVINPIPMNDLSDTIFSSWDTLQHRVISEHPLVEDVLNEHHEVTDEYVNNLFTSYTVKINGKKFLNLNKEQVTKLYKSIKLTNNKETLRKICFLVIKYNTVYSQWLNILCTNFCYRFDNSHFIKLFQHCLHANQSKHIIYENYRMILKKPNIFESIYDVLSDNNFNLSKFCETMQWPETSPLVSILPDEIFKSMPEGESFHRFLSKDPVACLNVLRSIKQDSFIHRLEQYISDSVPRSYDARVGDIAFERLGFPGDSNSSWDDRLPRPLVKRFLTLHVSKVFTSAARRHPLLNPFRTLLRSLVHIVEIEGRIVVLFTSKAALAVAVDGESSRIRCFRRSDFLVEGCLDTRNLLSMIQARPPLHEYATLAALLDAGNRKSSSDETLHPAPRAMDSEIIAAETENDPREHSRKNMKHKGKSSKKIHPPDEAEFNLGLSPDPERPTEWDLAKDQYVQACSRVWNLILNAIERVFPPFSRLLRYPRTRWITIALMCGLFFLVCYIGFKHFGLIPKDSRKGQSFRENHGIECSATYASKCTDPRQSRSNVTLGAWWPDDTIIGMNPSSGSPGLRMKEHHSRMHHPSEPSTPIARLTPWIS